MIANLVDHTIQNQDCFGDPISGQVGGLVGGGLKAVTDLEQAADDPVQQCFAVFLAVGNCGSGQVGRHQRLHRLTAQSAFLVAKHTGRSSAWLTAAR